MLLYCESLKLYSKGGWENSNGNENENGNDNDNGTEKKVDSLVWL